jgi:peptidoglycan/LPS O-acetylase OafA/YrhL
MSLHFITDTISCGYLPEPTLVSLKSVITGLALTILPSFLNFWGGKSKAKIYPTTYLDGLRGFAALFVFFNHSVFEWFPGSFNGWDGQGNNHLIQFPWVRLLISGHSMVSIFFVVSGFSISYKPMKLLHSGDTIGFFSSVASFVFRRHLRLFLPIVLVSFFMMVAAFGGFYQPGNGSRVPRFPTFFEQIYYWLYNFAIYANPFRPIEFGNLWGPGAGFDYDLNLWTIPVEFRGSVVVFFALVSFSYLLPAARLCSMMIIISYCLYTGFWDLFLFLTGAVYAELHFILRERKAQCETPTQIGSFQTSSTKGRDLAMNLFWITNFIAATFLLSIPGSPGNGGRFWPMIWSWTPTQYVAQSTGNFWPSLAAVHFVFIVEHAPFIQKIFTTPFARYLGKISYSIYMVHGTILRTFGRYFVSRTLLLTGWDTPFWYGTGVAIGWSVVVMVVFWAADLATRLADQKAVEIAKWAYDSLTRPVDEKEEESKITLHTSILE